MLSDGCVMSSLFNLKPITSEVKHLLPQFWFYENPCYKVLYMTRRLKNIREQQNQQETVNQANKNKQSVKVKQIQGRLSANLF